MESLFAQRTGLVHERPARSFASGADDVNSLSVFGIDPRNLLARRGAGEAPAHQQGALRDRPARYFASGADGVNRLSVFGIDPRNPLARRGAGEVARGPKKFVSSAPVRRSIFDNSLN